MITFKINSFSGNDRVIVSDMSHAREIIESSYAYLEVIAGLLALLYGRRTLTRSTLEFMGIDADSPAVRVEMTNLGLEWSNA